MKILLSIKRDYSDKIFSGEKRFEFRRQKPRQRFEIVLVYESTPTKKIVGWFSVKKVIQGSPEELWTRYKDVAGIKEDDYFKYCGDKNVVYALEIDKTHRFESPIDPYILDDKFRPPQNFTYLSNSRISMIIPDTDRGNVSGNLTID